MYLAWARIEHAALSAIACAAALGVVGCGLQDRDVDARRNPRKVPQFESSAGRNAAAGESGGESGGGGDPEGGKGGGGPGGVGGPTTVGGGNASTGGGGGGEPAGPVFDAGIEPDRNDVQAGELCERMATIQCA